MDWSDIIRWSFFITLVLSTVRLAVPVLLAVLGEIITERAGVLNLGLDGVMWARRRWPPGWGWQQGLPAVCSWGY
jgi:hypothetical protein